MRVAEMAQRAAEARAAENGVVGSMAAEMEELMGMVEALARGMKEAAAQMRRQREWEAAAAVEKVVVVREAVKQGGGKVGATEGGTVGAARGAGARCPGAQGGCPVRAVSSSVRGGAGEGAIGQPGWKFVR